MSEVLKNRLETILEALDLIGQRMLKEKLTLLFSSLD